MNYSTTMWEKLIDMRIRSDTFVSKNQFRLMSQKSIIELIYCVRQLVNEVLEKKRIYIWYLFDLQKRLMMEQRDFEVDFNEESYDKVV